MERKRSPRASRAHRKALRDRRKSARSAVSGPEVEVAHAAAAPTRQPSDESMADTPAEPAPVAAPEPSAPPATEAAPLAMPLPEPVMEEPTAHAVPRERLMPAPAMPTPPPLMEATPRRARRGLPLVSQSGFIVAAVGLALLAFSFYYAWANYPSNFNPAGISGIRLAVGLAVAGFVVGVVFLFVPGTRPGPPLLGAEAHAYQLRTSRVLAGLGLAATLLGLIVAALVYRAAVQAGPGTDVTVGGSPESYDSLAALGALVALGGLILWAGFGLRAKALLETAPAEAEPPPVPAPPTSAADPAPPALAAPANPAAGVNKEELHAMMRRIDSLLAALPDDVVRDFSKSSEADTYLKLMRESEPDAPS